MTNIDALAAVYAALGGSDPVPDGATNADVIAMIARAIDSGAAGVLPAVTARDDGKVLTVVDGKWAAAPPQASATSVEIDGATAAHGGT